MDNNAKLRPLYLAKILYERTDEDHYLTTMQLAQILEEEYGIPAHRQTIKTDIELLQQFGIDIQEVKSTQNRYNLINGTGMDDAQMNIAMQYGSKSPTETRDSSDLGRYGLGLKTASLSQCRVLTVISKQGDQVIGRRWDLDYVIKTGAWSLLILDKEDFASVPHISDLYEQDTAKYPLPDVRVLQ